jgi:hypothetical protein
LVDPNGNVLTWNQVKRAEILFTTPEMGTRLRAAILEHINDANAVAFARSL